MVILYSNRIFRQIRSFTLVLFLFLFFPFSSYFVMVFLGGLKGITVDGYMGPSIPKGQRLSLHPGKVL